MSDLISRQDALDAFGLSEKTRKYGGDHSGYDTRMLYEIQNVLESLPSAQPEQPEIITCRDCLYGKGDIFDRGMWCELHPEYDVLPNDFCSQAEKEKKDE